MNAIEIYAILKKKITSEVSSISNNVKSLATSVSNLDTKVTALDSKIQDLDVTKLDNKLNQEIADRIAADKLKQDLINLYIDEDGDICQR